MGLSLSMIRREQARQAARKLANTPHKPRPLAIKSQARPLIEAGVPKENLITYDCSVCKTRFVWDVTQALERCPLCNAGARQKANKLPGKRLTHKQRRRAASLLPKYKIPYVQPLEAERMRNMGEAYEPLPVLAGIEPYGRNAGKTESLHVPNALYQEMFARVADNGGVNTFLNSPQDLADADIITQESADALAAEGYEP